MKVIIKLIVAFLLSIIISYFSDYRPNTTTLNVLYTVSGILFSVGLGLIITIVPNGVKNPTYIAEIRKTINFVKNRFFIEFTIITLFSGIAILFSLPYFVINFLEIQRLNNDIFDRITQEAN